MQFLSLHFNPIYKTDLPCVLKAEKNFRKEKKTSTCPSALCVCSLQRLKDSAVFPETCDG